MTALVLSPVDAASRLRMFNHFAQRLNERFAIGGARQAMCLWQGLAVLLERGDTARLRPVVRTSRSGRRVFVCRLADGRALFVLFDCDVGLPITVLSEGMTVCCERKGTIRLQVPHGFD